MAASEHKVYYRNLGTLITGSAIAQLLSVALAPLFSRLYAPEDFGYLATFMSLLTGLSVVVCLRFDAAIVPAPSHHASHLFNISIKTAFITGSITLLAVALFQFFSNANSHLVQWLWLLPLMMLLNGFNQTVTAWLNRQKLYSLIAQNNILKSIATNGVILLAGIVGFKKFGLIGGYFTGLIIALALLVINLYGKRKLPSIHIFNPELRNIAPHYADFPKYNLPQAFTDMLLINSPVYFLTYGFNAAIVGWYGLTARILQAPFNLIGYAMEQVFIQKASEWHHAAQNIQPLMINVIKRSSAIAALIILPILLIGPDLFAWVFGEQWRSSGLYAQLLTPYFFFDFIRTPLARVPSIIAKQKQWYFWSLSGLAVVMITIVASILFKLSTEYFLIIFSISQSLIFLASLIWLFIQTGKAASQTHS
jgi:O-antigen/teichoic acid export membrane protein